MNISIIEDHRPLRENLCHLLAGEPGVSVTGAYPSAEAALREMPWQNADLLLVDIDMPGLSGADLIHKVKPQMPRLKIVAYTISEDRDTVFAALKAGALGYLLKGCPPGELTDSLRRLYQGAAPMSPRIARKVIRELHPPETGKGTELLSPREKEVLTGISLGKSYQELAQDFGVSSHTIHTHIKHVYEKLQTS